MLLRKQPVRSRAFAIQFMEVMQEFGAIIPWLHCLQEIPFYTDSSTFEQKLLERFGLKQGGITPYQLLSPETGREFFGGVIEFSKTPESFLSPELQKAQVKLENAGASYISCLQIRGVKRGEGNGEELVRRTITRILSIHPEVWGVCERNLTSWYHNLGAVVHSSGDNVDNLALISWRK